jgi:hypothetical protein
LTTLSNISASQQLFAFLQIIITSFCLLFSNNAFSEELDIEYKIKAAYLYNFTKFIYWPPKNTTTFNLCLVGNDLFGNIIEPIEQKKVRGEKIALFRYSDLPKSFQHCHIIYFAFPTKIKNKSFEGILTIGERNNFIHEGGMIQFFKKNNRIKFYANQKIIEKNGLEISAKLLEIANVIEE